MEAKINPLNGFSQQVNHNLSEIRRLFNPQTERMGNRRKEERGGGEGEGWGRLRNFKPNEKYNTNIQVQQLTRFIYYQVSQFQFQTSNFGMSFVPEISSYCIDMIKLTGSASREVLAHVVLLCARSDTYALLAPNYKEQQQLMISLKFSISLGVR